MECKWLENRNAFKLLLLLGCVQFSVLTTVEVDPATIEVSGGTTNTSIITFQNGTHIVVSRSVSTIVLTCNASYPVMWSLDSLEQPWVTGTRSDRTLTDFKDKSTYKYSMSVTLGNHNGYPYTSQLSIEPEEYHCLAVNSSKNLVAKMTVIWEYKGIFSYWNTKHNKVVNGSYQVYWKEGERGESTEILIPCYSLGFMSGPVELFKREQNQTVRFIASENGTEATTSSARFEKYVGFLINSSFVQSEKEAYECHVKMSAQHSRSKRTPISIILQNSTKSPWDNETEESDEDYIYIGSEEDLLGRNKTGTNATQPVNMNDTIVPGSISFVKFSVIRLNSTEYKGEVHSTKKPDDSNEPLSTYLNRANPNLILEHNDSSITCCIKSGFNGSHTSDHMVLYHKWCTEPLLCLTSKHLMKKVYILYSLKYDSVESPKCRSIDKAGEYRSSFASNPALYICHMRTDRKVTRYEYNGDYYPKFHQNNSENSYFLSIDNQSAYATLQYYNQSGYTYLSDISNVTFYNGDTALFRCAGNGFFYATSGYMWELQWKNGTTVQYASSAFQTYTYYSVPNSMRVNITDSLEKVSCHIPFWNSSDWVTKSFSIKVKASRSPTSAAGESSVTEDIEFYAGQSKVLQCDLQGHPPATYKWNLSSSVYSFLERTPLYYGSYGGSFYNRRPSTLISYREPTMPNVTVSLYAANYVENSSLPIPQQVFTCTATNLVGSGTKAFRVQAIRTVKPEIAHGSREIMVLFLQDEHKSLNCTVLKGLPFPEFYWRKHDMNISTTSEHHEIQVVGNSSILTFKSITYEDEGDYTCVVSNLAGRGFRQFSVRVRERPHSRYWYEFAIFVMMLVLIVMFGSLAYVYVTKSKKINRLKLRAEYSNLFGKHESRITVATLDD